MMKTYSPDQLKAIRQTCNKDVPPASALQQMFMFTLAHTAEHERLFHHNIMNLARVRDATKTNQKRLEELSDKVENIEGELHLLHGVRLAIDQLTTHGTQYHDARLTALEKHASSSTGVIAGLHDQLQKIIKAAPTNLPGEVTTLSNHVEVLSSKLIMLSDERDAMQERAARAEGRLDKLDDLVRCLTRQQAARAEGSGASKPQAVMILPMGSSDKNNLELVVPRGSPILYNENRPPTKCDISKPLATPRREESKQPAPIRIDIPKLSASKQLPTRIDTPELLASEQPASARIDNPKPLASPLCEDMKQPAPARIDVAKPLASPHKVDVSQPAPARIDVAKPLASPYSEDVKQPAPARNGISQSSADSAIPSLPSKKQPKEVKTQHDGVKEHLEAMKEYRASMMQHLSEKDLKQYDKDIKQYEKDMKQYEQNMKQYEKDKKRHEEDMKRYNRDMKEIEEGIKQVRDARKISADASRISKQIGEFHTNSIHEKEPVLKHQPDMPSADTTKPAGQPRTGLFASIHAVLDDE